MCIQMVSGYIPLKIPYVHGRVCKSIITHTHTLFNWDAAPRNVYFLKNGEPVGCYESNFMTNLVHDRINTILKPTLRLSMVALEDKAASGPIRIPWASFPTGNPQKSCAPKDPCSSSCTSRSSSTVSVEAVVVARSKSRCLNSKFVGTRYSDFP